LKAENYFNIACEDDAPVVFEAPKLMPIVKNKGMKGMIYMAISAFFFSIMALLLKILYSHSLITAYEITYWQNLLMTVV
jgi:hypothetical protein